ncbi:MAG: tRNA (adenosine(37)-N6)-threonylcarbamoyltransferase complex dimerization subunit type 1 TsaB [Deltaproteobacteria bacterium]|nr:tRNA (adenosine(37)-N6)-threonylcarbamoyltransferase complex dimerization subunit type 1 TsaB [Deltaproteobacteria bacterium]
MKVLGLDTSTMTSGIAVVDGDRVLAEARHDASGRKADLLVAIDDCCKRAGVGPKDLDAVAVGAGPGSFTGLRIGMATAKGIAFATGKPLWAVSSLAALAFDASQDPIAIKRTWGIPGGAFIAALDARRGEVYAGCYHADETTNGWTLIGEERVLAPRDLATWVDQVTGKLYGDWNGLYLSYAGDALAAHPAELGTLGGLWLDAKTPSGVSVARLALSGARVDVLVGGGPTYIRPSEAEVMYPDGVPGALRRRDP